MTSQTANDVNGRLFDLVDTAAPDGWTLAHIQHIVVGNVSETTARVMLQDGSSQDIVERLGWDFDDLTDRLKAEAYRESQGSWLTAEFTFQRMRTVKIDLDYDDEPQWNVPVVAMTYVEEQERFPRGPDSMPIGSPRSSARLTATKDDRVLSSRARGTCWVGP